MPGKAEGFAAHYLLMLGNIRRGRSGQQSPIPEARVVQGRHAPSWRRQEPHSVAASPMSTTYVRTKVGSDSALALLMGFWPLIAIMSMSVAMVWSASVYNGP